MALHDLISLHPSMYLEAVTNRKIEIFGRPWSRFGTQRAQSGPGSRFHSNI
jgi:hypothetical protein